MNLLVLAWKNILGKPLANLLTLVLFALGVGLISLLFLLDHQIQQNFEKNLAKVDLVVGAKGSPLQMILSSMYHIDAPTGNVSLQSVKPFLNPKHPLIASVVSPATWGGMRLSCPSWVTSASSCAVAGTQTSGVSANSPSAKSTMSMWSPTCTLPGKAKALSSWGKMINGLGKWTVGRCTEVIRMTSDSCCVASG